MESQIILLYAARYEIVDERTGVFNRGITCNYYFNTDLKAEDNANGSKGTRPAKGNLDYALWDKIVAAPAIYNAKFEMTVGSDGKPVLKIADIDYLNDAKIVPVGK